MSESRNLSEARRWLAQARHDRDAARLNRDHGFHEHACFLAQQAAEKALKALLYARGEGPVIGHSTLSLVREAARLEAELAGLEAPCRRLDQLYIPTRDPNGLPDNTPHDFFDRAMADQALGDLDAVLGSVERLAGI